MRAPPYVARVVEGARGPGGGAAWRLALLVACVAVTGLVSARPARADNGLGSYIPGYDISWPQCNKPYPPGPVAFGIIGINNGRPFTANPCFMDQYRWASRLETNPGVYVNVDYPRPGRHEGDGGPFGLCSPEDAWCRAYNYGYGTAKEAVTRAVVLGLRPSVWWLDIETNNYWSNDPVYNVQVIRGTLEYFKERNLQVGIYGTPYQWRIIAGDFAPGLPIWTAGAQGVEGAAARCGNSKYAFAGGRVHLVQYYDYGFDTNYVCPDSDLIQTQVGTDPFGRPGPASRSTGAGGRALPFWSVMPFLSN